MNIVSLTARQIIDSRGNPTVEAEVVLDSGHRGRASAPSGASTGVHEAHELRDGDKKAYGGKSVMQAVENITNTIAQEVTGLRADDQFLIDQKLIDLDGTENKSRLGANAILAVSLACAHAAAQERSLALHHHINDIAGNPTQSIPMPMMNLLNGGRHASQSSDFQEFMVIPFGAETFPRVVQMGAELFSSLKSILTSKHISTAVGDEGGFTYPVTSNTQMLDLLVEACEKAGYDIGREVVFAMDIAASEFYKNGVYSLSAEGVTYSSEEMIDYLVSITRDFPVVSIEDGLHEDDWEGWQNMQKKLRTTQLVGDDLLVTNTKRLKKAIELQAANAILIKPNQIGTLTETLRAIHVAKESGWNTIISHRSGETEDVSIAHIAVGSGAGQIKTGSMSRSERTAKYNELLRISEANPDFGVANPFAIS